MHSRNSVFVFPNRSGGDSKSYSNPYLDVFCQGIVELGWEVRPLTARAIFSRAPIVVHWPEWLFHHPKSRFPAGINLIVAVFFALIRRRRLHLVQHNLVPNFPQSGSGKVLTTWLARRARKNFCLFPQQKFPSGVNPVSVGLLRHPIRQVVKGKETNDQVLVLVHKDSTARWLLENRESWEGLPPARVVMLPGVADGLRDALNKLFVELQHTVIDTPYLSSGSLDSLLSASMVLFIPQPDMHNSGFVYEGLAHGANLVLLETESSSWLQGQFGERVFMLDRRVCNGLLEGIVSLAMQRPQRSPLPSAFSPKSVAQALISSLEERPF